MVSKDSRQPDVPQEQPKNRRSREWLREVFATDPPKSPREALRRFAVGLIALTAAMLGTSFLFEVVGWSRRYGALVGLALGCNIAVLYLNRQREPRPRGTRNGD